MEEHFGFTKTPFTREFPPDERIGFDFLDLQCNSLAQAVESRMSACLMAPAGTGKTVILRTLKNRLPEVRYKVSYIKITGISSRDLCREVAHVVGARSAGTLPCLIRHVQERVEQNLDVDGIRGVILIDEAHRMRHEGFELLKLLTNFAMDSKLVISLVLCGQADLKTKLYHPGLEDFRGRLTHCGELRLLSRDESQKYIKHRTAMAGLRTCPFDKGALEAIYEMTRGNMRAIDKLGLKSLQKAADVSDSAVGQQHVLEAKHELWI